MSRIIQIFTFSLTPEGMRAASNQAEAAASMHVKPGVTDVFLLSATKGGNSILTAMTMACEFLISTRHHGLDALNRRPPETMANFLINLKANPELQNQIEAGDTIKVIQDILDSSRLWDALKSDVTEYLLEMFRLMPNVDNGSGLALLPAPILQILADAFSLPKTNLPPLSYLKFSVSIPSQRNIGVRDIAYVGSWYNQSAG